MFLGLFDLYTPKLARYHRLDVPYSGPSLLAFQLTVVRTWQQHVGLSSHVQDQCGKALMARALIVEFGGSHD